MVFIYNMKGYIYYIAQNWNCRKPRGTSVFKIENNIYKYMCVYNWNKAACVGNAMATERQCDNTNTNKI